VNIWILAEHLQDSGSLTQLREPVIIPESTTAEGNFCHLMSHQGVNLALLPPRGTKTLKFSKVSKS
jgi:hypothetical protein